MTKNIEELQETKDEFTKQNNYLEQKNNELK